MNGQNILRQIMSGWAFPITLAVLLPLYLLTLQTIPNGAEHYYMIDVGETQIVLNTWGTLHATGYPLYIMLGNALVGLFRAVGVAPETAPGLVSLLWGLLALALIYRLMAHLTERPLIAAIVTALFGLTRTVWIHNAIAEIYSFGLLLLALLLTLALWKQPIRGRIYWLALVGGIGVFHHRALLMVAPALLYAVWQEFSVLSSQFSVEEQLSSQSSVLNPSRPALRTLYSVLGTLLFGLIGFLPYLYLPLRAKAGATWVYGQPGTWDGFWDQFFGREASRFIGAPASWDGLLANFQTVNTVLVTDLTAPGIILGMAGLIVGIQRRKYRRAAITLLIGGVTAYLFHVFLYTDVLSALILPVTLSLAFGWLFLTDALAGKISPLALAAVMLLFGAFLTAQNLPFIRELTTDTTGLETIRLAESAPPGSVLMLDWGPRLFAVGFAKDVWGQLPHVTLLDHRADFRQVTGRLLTPEFTFYNRPVAWWEERLDSRVYLSAAAPRLVEIRKEPEMTDVTLQPGIAPIYTAVTCSSDTLTLQVDWAAAEKPERDLSVFVHLLDSEGEIIAQDDRFAPVYGWRPTTTWEAGEIVRDYYVLNRGARPAVIRYGLYRRLDDGTFVNEYEYEIPVACEG